jgi:hypothetical protein
VEALEIKQACTALGARIVESSYAIIGGTAVQLLRSMRLTEDVDFVVPQGTVAAARKMIARAKDEFTVHPRTRHTHYRITQTPVEAEILSPPALFKKIFDAETPVHEVVVDGQSIRILKPALILDAKCRSILGLPTEKKKLNDAIDIIFLLQWLAANNTVPLAHEVPNASKGFVELFIKTYNGIEDWTNSGYSPERVNHLLSKLQLSKLTFTTCRLVLSPRPCKQDHLHCYQLHH